MIIVEWLYHSPFLLNVCEHSNVLHMISAHAFFWYNDPFILPPPLFQQLKLPIIPGNTVAELEVESAKYILRHLLPHFNHLMSFELWELENVPNIREFGLFRPEQCECNFLHSHLSPYQIFKSRSLINCPTTCWSILLKIIIEWWIFSVGDWNALKSHTHNNKSLGIQLLRCWFYYK